jgi:predicted methyltransferase
MPRSSPWLAALAVVGFGLGAAAAAEAPPPNARQALSAALNDPERAMHRPADERRKPAQLIAFAGVKPGDRVLDLIPGDGYWTRIFSKLVGPRGKVYAVWPEAYAKLAAGNVATLRTLSASSHYGNIVTEVQPTTRLTAPERLDVVWTSQNYHDYPDPFMGPTDPAVLNRAVYAILRPGGTYMVIDHEAPAGSGMRDTDTLHRIDPAIVIAQVKAAGFRYAGRSRILANPKDPLTVKVFDPSIRGHTSQFALKFVKPR